MAPVGVWAYRTAAGESRWARALTATRAPTYQAHPRCTFAVRGADRWLRWDRDASKEALPFDSHWSQPRERLGQETTQSKHETMRTRRLVLTRALGRKSTPEQASRYAASRKASRCGATGRPATHTASRNLVRPLNIEFLLDAGLGVTTGSSQIIGPCTVGRR